MNAEALTTPTRVTGIDVGTDGEDHGCVAEEGAVAEGTFTAVPDPTIPAVWGNLSRPPPCSPDPRRVSDFGIGGSATTCG